MLSPDLLVKATAADNTIRALAAVTTALAEEARVRHQTAPTASAALGRTLTASLLLGSMLKEDEKLSLQFMGRGPLRGIFAEANGQGEVRGFVYHPRTHLPLNRGKLNVGGAVGAGTLTVIRAQSWNKEPYRSVLPIVSGEIGADIAHYLLSSEQIPSAVSLGVFVAPTEAVVAAGGFILQVMPGASPETIAQLETCVARAKPVSQLVREGASPIEIITHALEGFTPMTVGEVPVRFVCRCSRERVMGALVALGVAEIRDLVKKEGQARVTCEFCNEQYVLDRGELEALIASC
ncbi:MAG: Hsp33 family molecular chaperone HslO [Deltaproteobacteria bacterium]|nr:Hsp33 family molecular chaperone HslO [Deltaproteobacteria bacterium]